MSVGNVYVYSVNSHSGGGYDTTYLRRGTIDRDSLIDGRKYYFINSIKFNGWYRVDTATGSLYKYDSVGSCSHYINEILIDSLSSSPGGLNYSCIPGQSAIVICSFENRELFGQNIFHKKFSYSYNVGPATFTYNSYYAMLSRCTNTQHKDYPNYGGRGVLVQPEWIESFDNFLADVGLRPEHTSLDRISPNRHYTKDNVRWASQHVQNMNKRKRYQGLWSKVLKPQAEKV